MASDDTSTIAPNQRADSKSMHLEKRLSLSKDSFISRDDETLVCPFEGYSQEKQPFQQPKRTSPDDQIWVTWALPLAREPHPTSTTTAVSHVRKKLVNALARMCKTCRLCTGSAVPRPITVVDSAGLSLSDYISIVDREFLPQTFPGQLVVDTSHLLPPCNPPQVPITTATSLWAERVHSVVAERISERYEHKLTALSVRGTHDVLIHWAQLSRESPFLRRVCMNLEHPVHPWSATLDLDTWHSESDGDATSPEAASVPVPAPALHVKGLPLHQLAQLQASISIYMSIPWTRLAHLSLSVVITQQRFCSYNHILHCISNLRSLQSLSITLTCALPSFSYSATPCYIPFTPPAEPMRLPHLHRLELDFPFLDYDSANFVEHAFDLRSLAHLRIARGAQDSRRSTTVSEANLRLAKLFEAASTAESLSLVVCRVDVNDLIACLEQCAVKRFELALFDAMHLVRDIVGVLDDQMDAYDAETGTCTPFTSSQVVRLHSAVWSHVKEKLRIDQRRLLSARIGKVCGAGSTSLKTVKAFRDRTRRGNMGSSIRESVVLEEVWEKELNGQRTYFVNVFRVLSSCEGAETRSVTDIYW